MYQRDGQPADWVIGQPDFQQEGQKRQKKIVEAQGWIFHENGVVELVAYKTDVNGSPAQPKDPRVCPKREK